MTKQICHICSKPKPHSTTQSRNRCNKMRMRKQREGTQKTPEQKKKPGRKPKSPIIERKDEVRIVTKLSELIFPAPNMDKIDDQEKAYGRKQIYKLMDIEQKGSYQEKYEVRTKIESIKDEGGTLYFNFNKDTQQGLTGIEIFRWLSKIHVFYLLKYPGAQMALTLTLMNNIVDTQSRTRGTQSIQVPIPQYNGKKMEQMTGFTAKTWRTNQGLVLRLTKQHPSCTVYNFLKELGELGILKEHLDELIGRCLAWNFTDSDTIQFVEIDNIVNIYLNVPHYHLFKPKVKPLELTRYMIIKQLNNGTDTYVPSVLDKKNMLIKQYNENKDAKLTDLIEKLEKNNPVEEELKSFSIKKIQQIAKILQLSEDISTTKKIEQQIQKLRNPEYLQTKDIQQRQKIQTQIRKLSLCFRREFVVWQLP